MSANEQATHELARALGRLEGRAELLAEQLERGESVTAEQLYELAAGIAEVAVSNHRHSPISSVENTHEIMTTDEVAALLRRPVGTLRYWRHRGEGPPSFRVGGSIAYDRSAVMAWLDKHRADGAS